MEKDRREQQGQVHHDIPSSEESGITPETALENLKRFAGKDLNEINTLDDVASEMGIVVQSLQTTVNSSGERKIGGDIMRKPVQGGAEIFVSMGINLAYLSQYRMEGEQRRDNFRAQLPINEEIWQRERNMHVFAIDYRG